MASATRYILTEYNNKTRKIECESYKNFVKGIRTKFSIDEGQLLDIKMYDKTKNKYLNIDKYELKKIPEGALIRVVERKRKNNKSAPHTIKPSAVKPYSKKEIPKRNKWKVNSKIEIYSESQYQWQKGQIINIHTDAEGEWLVVKYCGFMTKEIQRFSQYIRPVQKVPVKKQTSQYTQQAQTVKEEQKEVEPNVSESGVPETIVFNDINQDKHLMQLMLKKKKERKQIMEETRNKILEASQNGSLYLLSKTKNISNVDLISENDIENGNFIITLDFEHKEWITNSAKYENIFKQEICQTLPQIDPSMINIQNVKEGSIIIDWIIVNIWMLRFRSENAAGYSPTNTTNTEPYEMKQQDQIEVEFEGKWYAATIIEIRCKSGVTGKYFKVRYNAVNGKDIFWKNTEWFYSHSQADRLRFPGQIITKSGEEWNPPGIAIDEQGVRVNNKHELKVGQHIYVYSKNYWFRCQILKRLEGGIGVALTVILLEYGGSSPLSLHLWKPEHRALIELRDMRDENDR
eukprot:47654_1